MFESRCITIVSRRNATSSWSGYLHQGKVGLYLASKEINKLYLEGKELDSYYLEYESAEDIDIIHEEKVVSRHQVKAKKNGKYPNDYKQVLSKTIGDDGEVKHVGFEIYDRNSNEIDKNMRFLHTIREVVGFGLSEREFENQYPPPAKFVENEFNVQLYPYSETEMFCDIADKDNDKIKSYCLIEIKKLLKHTGCPHFNNDDCQDAYYRLQSILEDKIRICHQTGSDKFPIISFKEITDLICNQEGTKIRNGTVLREVVYQCLEEFIIEEALEEKDSDKLYLIVGEINKYDNDKYIQFFQNINPDKTFSKDFSRIDLVKSLDYDALKDLFLYVIYKINNREFNLENLGYTENGGYLLTLINRRNESTMIQNLSEKIRKNFNSEIITRELFKKKYMVNDKINSEYILPETTEFSDVLPEEIEKYKKLGLSVKREDALINSKMRFVEVNKAIKELNNLE